MNWFSRFIVQQIIEKPARRSSIDGQISALEGGKAKVQAALAAATDTLENRKQARHIIGLERWGQRRLQVALGEPAVGDEMDSYEPADLSPDELAAVFAETRTKTVELARQIAAQGRYETQVAHNQFGSISVLGWLRYLGTHAAIESRRLR